MTSTSLPLTNILTFRARVTCSDVKATRRAMPWAFRITYYYGACFNHVDKVLYFHLNPKRTKMRKWSYTKFSMKWSLWIWLHSALIHKVAGEPEVVYCIYWVILCAPHWLPVIWIWPCALLWGKWGLFRSAPQYWSITNDEFVMCNGTNPCGVKSLCS